PRGATRARAHRMTNRQLYRRLLPFLRPYFWPHFVMAMVCMIIFSATNGVVPFLVKEVFDKIFDQKDLFALELATAGIVGLILVRGLVGYGKTYFTEYVGQKIIQDLRKALNDHIQRLPLSFFNRTATGNLISRVTNDVTAVRGALTESVAAVLKDATSLIAL